LDNSGSSKSEDQVIYFGSPLNFNDPYDCALVPNVAVPTDSDIEAIRKYYLSRTDLPLPARNEFEVSSTEVLHGTFTRAARHGLEKAIADFLNKRGVACFSEKNDDLLMWSHYGGRYRGWFCLEFSTHAEPFTKIRQVRYAKVLPTINVATVLMDRVADPILDDLFCTKSDAWAYEKEWRALHDSAGTAFCYKADVLTGVYFGPDIDQQALEIVCLILRGQNAEVTFWKGSRSSTEFRVSFEKFEYTSFLEAKAKRLL
jgi:hypothetical protein